MILTSLILHSPGPVLTQVGPLTLRWYGLLTALGFLIAVTCSSFLLNFRKKTLAENSELKQITEDDLTNFSVLLLIFGIIGARLWYVILKWDYYSSNLFEIVQIWHGGQSIQGGIIGAIIGALIFSKNLHRLFFKLSLAASVLPVAQAIGRWGNFFNEEAYGAPVQDLPIKLFISKTGLFHHPTFLYEAIWNLFNFIFMMMLNFILYKKDSKFSTTKKDLIIISCYMIFYSTGRLIIEAIRTDSLMLGGLAAASAVSIGMIVVGAVTLTIVLCRL